MTTHATSKAPSATAAGGKPKPEEAPQPRAPWGPAAAIIGTVFIYFASQIISSVIIVTMAAAQGLSGEQMARWSEQTDIHFLYILIAEATVVGMVWGFLRLRR